jgi:pimeloyl-ACP methyl ester carboxylesterase
MYVHEGGPVQGPVVLFLHGEGANGTMWNHHANRLKDHHCLAPDYPGFGRSKDQEWSSIDEIVNQLVDLIRKYAKEGKIHIVGTSLGGTLAIKLLGAIPGLLESVIVDGAGVLPFPGAFIMKVGLRVLEPFLHTDFVLNTISRTLIKIPEGNFEEFKEDMLSVTPSSFTRSIIEASQVSQPRGLGHVTCRVLFIAGENDPKSILRSNAMLAKLMPHAMNCVVLGVGHGWIREETELHIRMVEAWLEGRSLPSEFVRAGF